MSQRAVFTGAGHEGGGRIVTKTWLIIGDGGHASSLASVIGLRGDTVAAISGGPRVRASAAEHGAQAFLSDAEAFEAALANGWSICVGIGDNVGREEVCRALLSDPAYIDSLQPLVAKTASVDPSAVISPLAQVCEHAHVGPASAIGPGAIVNTSAIVEHGARLGAFSHLAPGGILLGLATVGERCLIGAGARILPSVKIAANSTVGAGAVVLDSVDENTTVAGVPARVIMPRSSALNVES